MGALRKWRLYMKAYWYNPNRKNVAGLQIRRLRLAHGLTIRELATRIQLSGESSITENTITKIEHGTRFIPDYEISVFAKALHSTPDFLLSFDEAEPSPTEAESRS